MICKECKHCYKGWIKSSPEEYWCIGVKHPFKIENIDHECTEYFDGDQYTIPTWADLELLPDTYLPPTFTMLVGIPGVGKSTYAKALAENSSAVWLNSDYIREKLYGDAACQDNPNKVFEIMHEETLSFLDKGFDVIYDATSITRKSRLSILNKLPKYVRKKCIIVWAPIDVCVERDKARDRTVGKEVIDKMLRRFEAPFYDEGFDQIAVYLSDVHYNRMDYYAKAIAAMNIPHDNPHHTLNIMEHCYECGHALIGEAPPIVVKAGYLHDIGKPYTKEFKNSKGEPCETAHYYGHNGVGAWISYGFRGHNITLAWLISAHMAPFINQKYYDSLPACYKLWVGQLHKADREAH
jgi:predicted kinase